MNLRRDGEQKPIAELEMFEPGLLMEKMQQGLQRSNLVSSGEISQPIIKNTKEEGIVRAV